MKWFVRQNVFRRSVVDSTKQMTVGMNGRKTFSKFYRRYYDLISKFQIGLKSLLRQGLS